MTDRRPRKGQPIHAFRAALLGLALVLASAVMAAADRVALVIGEANYQTLPVLKTPALNASLMAEALQSLHFKVTTLIDANNADLSSALDQFTTEAATADTVLVYFSGAAFQYQGVNHLVPIDATLATAAAVDTQTLRLDALITRLANARRPLLVFIDSGPGNPLPAALQGASGPGLAQPALSGHDPLMVALSAEPGHAPVAESGAFSTFTLGLQTYLPSAGKPLADVMRWVQRDLEAATGKAQTPWVYSTLDAAYSLSQTDQYVTAPPEPLPSALPGETAAAPAAPARSAEAEPPKRMAQGPLQLPRGHDSQLRAGESAAPTIALLPTLRQSVPDQHAAPLPATADGVRLAAIPPGTTLTPATPALTPLPGTEVLPDGTRVPMLDAAELPKAIQQELTRVGCYNGAIDGDFGAGSHGALTDYLKAKNLPTDQTDPTSSIYIQLLGETDKVCKAPPPPAKPAVTPQKPQANPPAKPQVNVAPTKPPPVAATPDANNGKIKKLILIPNF